VLEPADDKNINSVDMSGFQNDYAQAVEEVGYTRTETSGISNVTELVVFTENEVSAGKTVPWDEISAEELPPPLPVVRAESPWWPFASKGDWELASWFARSKVSKESIKDYFRNPALVPERPEQQGALKNYTDLMRAMYTIPYGIPRQDFWEERRITVAPQVKGGKPEQHIVLFRPIQPCLEFLLGHRPFAPYLVWAPVKKSYGTQGSRVYDEMHTGEWWWDMQTKLPPGATIIPLIIATDKTLMTQLRGDQSAWPVYLTIGNLPREIRRKQTIPATLLIGFLPISKDITKSSDSAMAYSVKSELYHQAMSAIFERMYYSNLSIGLV
jgi:hypothetical protein